jgi:cysteine desulfurase
VGFGEAARIARVRLVEEAAATARRRDRLAAALIAGIPGLVVTAGRAPRLPNTLHVCAPEVSGRALLRAAPEVLASTGAACHAHGVETSAVLVAMGVPPALARGALRLSLGPTTTDDEVDRAAAALIRAAGALRASP